MAPLVPQENAQVRTMHEVRHSPAVEQDSHTPVRYYQSVTFPNGVSIKSEVNVPHSQKKDANMQGQEPRPTPQCVNLRQHRCDTKLEIKEEGEDATFLRCHSVSSSNVIPH